MFGYKDISIDFLTGTPVLGWLALIAVLALSVYLYFRTNPPLPLYIRILLGGLRVIAVLALLGALLEPVISFTREFERSRRVTVLVDSSSSMDREEQGMTRAARVDSLLNSDSYARFISPVDITTVYFGDSLTESPTGFSRDKTALGEALYQLEKSEIADRADNWVLLTDGKSNTGRSPVEVVRGSSVPITTVNIATDVGNFDVGLEDLGYNAVVFVGQPTEIKAKLEWHNASGKKARVELRSGNRVLAGKDFSIDQDDGFGEVALNYVPEEPGQKLLQVRIPTLDQEETSGNNSRTIALKVLKSRVSVLLVSQAPDHELGFLNRHLAQSDKYEVELRVLGTRAGNLGGRFPDRQADLNRFDLVILHDLDPNKLAGSEQILRSYLSEKGGALWVIYGEQYASARTVPWFNELLPFHPSRRIPVEYRDFNGEPSENELFHPVVRLAEDRTSIREAWAGLPPFKSLVICDVVADDASILVQAGMTGGRTDKLPVIGYRRFGPGKVVSCAALPFWHWGFVNIGFGEDGGNYDRLIDGAVSWLTVREDFDPVRVTPSAEVFNRGETVRFEGVAFDQGFRPIPGVSGTVSLTLEPGTDKYEADLIEKSEGHYLAEFTKIPPGTYRYSGVIEKDGVTLKRNSGLISVEEFSLEDADQSGDPALLMAIARESGGEYHTYAEFDEALERIPTEPIRESIAGEVPVWSSFWLLVVFVVSLAAEWGLRKFNHLL